MKTHKEGPTTDHVPTTAATPILDARGRWQKPTKKMSRMTPAARNNQREKG